MYPILSNSLDSLEISNTIFHPLILTFSLLIPMIVVFDVYRARKTGSVTDPGDIAFFVFLTLFFLETILFFSLKILPIPFFYLGGIPCCDSLSGILQIMRWSPVILTVIGYFFYRPVLYKPSQYPQKQISIATNAIFWLFWLISLATFIIFIVLPFFQDKFSNKPSEFMYYID